MPSIRTALLVLVAEASQIPSSLASVDSCLSAGDAESCGLSLLQLRVEPHRAPPRTLDSVIKSPKDHAQLFSSTDPGHYVSQTGGDVGAWSSAQNNQEQDLATKGGKTANPFDTAAAQPVAASEAIATPEQPVAGSESLPQHNAPLSQSLDGQAPLAASESPVVQGATANPFHTAAAKPVAASEQAFAAPQQPAAASGSTPPPLLAPRHQKGKRDREPENPFDTAAAKPLSASEQAVTSSEPNLKAAESAPSDIPLAAPEDVIAADTIPDLVAAAPVTIPGKAAAASTASMANGATAAPDGAQSSARVPKASAVSGAAPPAFPRGPGNAEGSAVSGSKKKKAIEPEDPFSGWLYEKDGARSEDGAKSENVAESEGDAGTYVSSADVDSSGAQPGFPASERVGKQMGMGKGAGMGVGKEDRKLPSSGDKKTTSRTKEDRKKASKVPHVRGLDRRGDAGMSVFTGKPGSFVDLQDFPGKMGGPEGFSVAFDAAWFELGKWASVIDFGSGDGQDNIVVSNTEHSDGLSFHVYRHGHVSTLDIKNVIELKTMNRYLCSVSKHGEMKVFKDGKMIGHRRRGNVPAAVSREHLLIGKSNWEKQESAFTGEISDLCIWNKQVSWKDASDCITSSSSSLVYSAHHLPGIMAANPGAHED